MYIMLNDFYSVVKGYVDKVDKHNTLKFEPNHTGWTSWAAGKTISEVYVKGCASDLDVIAKTVFHESMHYKTHWQDSKLHKRGGLAASRVSANTPLTKKNISDMKAWLTHARTPVVDGCQIYNDLTLGILGMLSPDQHFHRAVAYYCGSVKGGFHSPGLSFGNSPLCFRSALS